MLYQSDFADAVSFPFFVECQCCSISAFWHSFDVIHTDNKAYIFELKRIVYHGEDENNPFEIQDVTSEANAYAPIVEANIDRLAAVKVQEAEVCCSCGDQCREPYECWYFGHCHRAK